MSGDSPFCSRVYTQGSAASRKSVQGCTHREVQLHTECLQCYNSLPLQTITWYLQRHKKEKMKQDCKIISENIHLKIKLCCEHYDDHDLITTIFPSQLQQPTASISNHVIGVVTFLLKIVLLYVQSWAILTTPNSIEGLVLMSQLF